MNNQNATEQGTTAIAEEVQSQLPPPVQYGTGGVKWRPSAKYPYFPAYDPTTCILYLQQEADGTTTPILKQRTPQEMDYDRHGIATVFGPVPQTLDLSKEAETLSRVQAGIKLINNEQAAEVPEGEAPAPLTQLIKPDWIVETSNEATWLLIGLDRIAAKLPNGETPDVFRAYAQIAHPVVSLVNETDYVKNFGSALTYLDLRDRLMAVVNEINPGLWGAANLRMTRTINRVLKQNLSLPLVQIDSFVDDIESLAPYLKDKYGPVVADAFTKRQREIIHNSFVALSDGTAKSLGEALMDDRDYEEGKAPLVTYIASNISFTYVNCWSHELRIELSKNTSAAIVESNTPLVYELLKGLFADTDTIGNFDRHFIRTNDGRVLEAAKGHIGENFFLLTLID